VFAEGTRVANKLLIIDLPRMPLLHGVQSVFLLPLAWCFRLLHDGHSSGLLPTARRRCGHWPGTPSGDHP
jgi:hypothetical protein